MKKDFVDKIVFVSGSTRGVGRCIAESFAKNGATVIINSRHEKDVFDTVKTFKKKNYRCFGAAADVSKFEKIKKTINEILKNQRKIDVLVNNAAVGYPGRFENIKGRSWEKTIRVNLTGVFNCCKVIFPTMKKQEGGKIVNIGSEAVKGGTLLADASYVASKAGIIGLTRQLAIEGGSCGVCVNTVSVPLIEGQDEDKLSEKYRHSARKIIELTPLGRLVEPIDVANLVLFLASRKADFITGQTISINGGLILA